MGLRAPSCPVDAAQALRSEGSEESGRIVSRGASDTDCRQIERQIARLTKPGRARCACQGRATHEAIEDGRRVRVGCVWCLRTWRAGR